MARVTPAEQDLLARAAARAIEWHADITRKSTSIPYVAHLLAVCALVLEHGGSTEQAAAALLHDALEDTPVTADELATEFGAEVARIVEACTDTLRSDPSRGAETWLLRKQAYVEHLGTADPAAALVAACDKLHNLGSLVADVAAEGPGYLDRFHAGPTEQLWYYGAVIDALGGRIPPRLSGALVERLGRFEELLRPPA